jgi:hypothetical protein
MCKVFPKHDDDDRCLPWWKIWLIRVLGGALDNERSLGDPITIPPRFQNRHFFSSVKALTTFDEMGNGDNISFGDDISTPQHGEMQGIQAGEVDDDDEVTSQERPRVLEPLSSLVEVTSQERPRVLEPLSSLVEVTSQERSQVLEPLSCLLSNCTSCVSVRQDLFLPDSSSLQRDHDNFGESVVDMDGNECRCRGCRAMLELISSIESKTDDSIAAAMILDEMNEELYNINNELVTEYAREQYYEDISTVGVQIFDAYSSMHSFLMRCVNMGNAYLDADLVAHQIQMLLINILLYIPAGPYHLCRSNSHSIQHASCVHQPLMIHAWMKFARILRPSLGI